MAKSALPLLLGAAAAFLILSKKNGGGGTQANIHIVEEGDSIESLLQEAVKFSGGERLALVISSFDPYGPSKVSEALLPYAQANPKVFYVVIAGPGLDAAAAWFGPDGSSAPANKFGVFIADSVGEADRFEDGITAENAAAKLDELIKWSVNKEFTAQGSGGIQGMKLTTSSKATTMSASTNRGLAAGPKTGTTGPGTDPGFGLASAPVGFSPEVVDSAVQDALSIMFS